MHVVVAIVYWFFLKCLGVIVIFSTNLFTLYSINYFNTCWPQRTPLNGIGKYDNMLCKFQGLGSSPLTFGANDIMMVLWVITPILPPTIRKVIMLVINPNLPHINKLWRKKLLSRHLTERLRTHRNWNLPRQLGGCWPPSLTWIMGVG